VGDRRKAVIWRLISSNHRELATSAVVFATLEKAQADAAATMKKAGQFSARHVLDSRQDRFSWILQNRTRVAVIASRWHSSKRERLSNLTAARDALARATVTDTLVEARPIGVMNRQHREKRQPHRYVPEAPLIEAGARQPIKDIRRFDEPDRAVGESRRR
jgi:hypothetical protein